MAFTLFSLLLLWVGLIYSGWNETPSHNTEIDWYMAHGNNMFTYTKVQITFLFTRELNYWAQRSEELQVCYSKWLPRFEKLLIMCSWNIIYIICMFYIVTFLWMFHKYTTKSLVKVVKITTFCKALFTSGKYMVWFDDVLFILYFTFSP